jgi:ferredoxin-fold anticodon binding domain-containing protein
MEQMHYLWEKFFLAVRALAISNEKIQVRLKNAYKELLDLDDLQAWPTDKLESKYQELKNELSSKGDIEVTIHYMRDEDAARLAEKIINMYDHIAKIEYPKVFPPD